jgi:hypothetical protein
LVKSLFFKTLAEKKPRERKRLNRAVALMSFYLFR